MDPELDASLTETFEGMAFAEAEALHGVHFEWDSPKNYWAKIVTTDPVQSELMIVMPSELALELAESVMPGFSDFDDDMLLQVLGEMLNTLAGGWLIRLLPDDQSVQMGLPETGCGDRAAQVVGCDIAVYEVHDLLMGIALRHDASK